MSFTSFSFVLYPSKKMSLNSSKVIMESPLMSASITISWRSSLERLIPSRVKTNLISDVDMYPLPSSNITCSFISRPDIIYLVKDPEDLLEVVLGLLLILPLHHQVDKFKEVHSTWAIFVSLLKLSWQSSGFRNLKFTSISSSNSSSVGEHPIDLITAPNSFVDTVPSPSCQDDYMTTTLLPEVILSPCRTSWTFA